MTKKILFTLLVLCVTNINKVKCDNNSNSTYWRVRQQLINSELNEYFGNEINLTKKEQAVNAILMTWKIEDLQKGYRNVSELPAANLFLKVRKDIERSRVFQAIVKMPKGCLLHSHDYALGTREFIYSATLVDDVYGCLVDDKFLRFKVSETPPTNEECEWTLLKTIREDPHLADLLDKFIMKNIALNDDTLDGLSTAQTWGVFEELFKTVSSLLRHNVIWSHYIMSVLGNLAKDNIQCMEYRGLTPSLYTSAGVELDPITSLNYTHIVIESFKTLNPDFISAKYIFAPSRTIDPKESKSYLETMRTLRREFPSLVAGFDLVGEEDQGSPNKYFLDILQVMASEGVKFFFHAGETQWSGTSIDENLVDAIMLQTQRIGHGLALVKHPRLLRKLKSQRIAIEVCPISNQVLGYVKDLRNHPMATLFAQNYPIVVASDDPAMWGASGLSYDFYEAFMGIMSAKSDLRALKQLGLNSITYSAMSDEEKQKANQVFARKWDEFIDWMLTETNDSRLMGSGQIV